MFLIQLQQSASSNELQHEEYRELSEKCWAKFYRCCLEYHQLLCQPVAIYQDPSTGLGVLVKKGVVSFVRPVGVTEYLSERKSGGKFSTSRWKNNSIIIFK